MIRSIGLRIAYMQTLCFGNWLWDNVVSHEVSHNYFIQRDISSCQDFIRQEFFLPKMKMFHREIVFNIRNKN